MHSSALRRALFLLPLALFCLPYFAQAAQTNVTITNMAFLPSSVSVNAGDTVVWTNNDSVSHTVTANDGSFDSGLLLPGATFSHTFATGGGVSYHCTIHPGMVASIAIAGGAVASSPNADDLRAQAQALLNRVTQLQAQVGGNVAPSNVTLDSSACPLIGRSLHRGSSGDDVSRLQQFLARDRNVYPEAQVSGYYGALTEAAVKRWQVKYNIVSSGDAGTTGYGVVGPRTAAAIALVCSTMSGGGGGVSGGGAAPSNVGGFIQVTPVAGNAPLSVKVVTTVNTVNSCSGGVYTVDYGDGTVPSSVAVPLGNCQQMTQTLGHTYLYGGQYLVTLSAGSHRTSATVVVYGAGAPQSGAPGSPQTDTVSANPTSGTSPLTVTLSGVINAPQTCGGGTYTLQFGDNQSVPLTFDSSTCSPRSFSVSHQYTAAGTYTAKLLNGSSQVSSVTVTVSGPTSGFGPMTVVPGVGGDPLATQAQFNGGCTTYSLNWGDGSTAVTGSCSSSAITLSHEYALSGSYTITLTRGSQVDTAAISIQ